MGWLTVLLVLIGIFIVPFIISNYLAKGLRVPDAGFGLGVIISAILAAGTVIFAALQPEQPIEYTVKEGDTVQSIVDQFDDLAIKTLVDENKLDGPQDLSLIHI